MIKKNICFFNSSKTWGGGEKWHFDMAVRVDTAKFTSFVITGKKSELSSRLKKTNAQNTAITISNLSFINPFKIYRIHRLLRRRGIDTIIINLSEDLKVAGIAARLANVKNIIYRRGSAIPIKNSLSNRLIFKHLVTGIIANSKETKRTILQNNPDLFPENKITIIYNGIDLEAFDKLPSTPLYQRQNNEIILGNAGRLSYEKGQKDLIKIAREFKNTGVPFKLLIAGDGNLKDALKEYARTLDLENEVIFLGFVDNIKNFMDTIDIFLLTSLWEGFGYVMIEAMASAKPVIGFAINTTEEIIMDGYTGFLIKNRDCQSFKDRILFLSNHMNFQREMGNNARLHVEKRFSIIPAVKKLEQYLDGRLI